MISILLKINFNPRSPCGERPFEGELIPHVFLFQSTLSLRRATSDDFFATCTAAFQSTLSLRRATRLRDCISGNKQRISIHALLAESDTILPRAWSVHQEFQSTLSLRRATAYAFKKLIEYVHFNPRSPCGERL